jgi:hypothetical protein
VVRWIAQKVELHPREHVSSWRAHAAATNITGAPEYRLPEANRVQRLQSVSLERQSIARDLECRRLLEDANINAKSMQGASQGDPANTAAHDIDPDSPDHPKIIESRRGPARLHGRLVRRDSTK